MPIWTVLAMNLLSHFPSFSWIEIYNNDMCICCACNANIVFLIFTPQKNISFHFSDNVHMKCLTS